MSCLRASRAGRMVLTLISGSAGLGSGLSQSMGLAGAGARDQEKGRRLMWVIQAPGDISFRRTGALRGRG